MNIIGSWTLHFDWGLTGNYHWVHIYFNFDGSFGYLAGANDGSWLQSDDHIILRFKTDGGKDTVYSGASGRYFMSGAMTSGAGERGHWFAIKKGTKIYSRNAESTLPYLVDKAGKPKFGAAGTPLDSET